MVSLLDQYETEIQDTSEYNDESNPVTFENCTLFHWFISIVTPLNGNLVPQRVYSGLVESGRQRGGVQKSASSNQVLRDKD